MKQCRKCHEVKPLDEFSKSSRSKDGLQSMCRKCHAEYQREWRRNNPGKQSVYNHRSYMAHREQRLEYDRRYYREHRDECLRRAKAWRVANLDIIEAYRKRRALEELRRLA